MPSSKKSLFSKYLSVVSRILPKAHRPPVVGIDIGTSTLKAVVISSAKGFPEIIAWCVQRIENDDIKGALAQMFSKIHFKNQIPVTAVSGKGTLIRYIDLPRMPLADLRKSFAFDLDKYFPFDPQSIYTDCFILDEKIKDKRMPVLVAAVKKELIDERIKLFKEAGVELSHITINSIATTNVFESLGPTVQDSQQAKAILDIGGTVSTLLVLKDKSPRFTRDIFIGSHEMTKQMVNSLGVDAAEAEKLKCAPGERINEVMNACDAAVSHLVSEIRLSLDYFMTEKNMQVDELFLLGGGSLLKGIETALEKNLGMPVKTWDPLEGIGLSEAVDSSDIRSYSAQLGVAIGLGLTKV